MDAAALLVDILSSDNQTRLAAETRLQVIMNDKVTFNAFTRAVLTMLHGRQGRGDLIFLQLFVTLLRQHARKFEAALTAEGNEDVVALAQTVALDEWKLSVSGAPEAASGMLAANLLAVVASAVGGDGCADWPDALKVLHDALTSREIPVQVLGAHLLGGFATLNGQKLLAPHAEALVPVVCDLLEAENEASDVVSASALALISRFTKKRTVALFAPAFEDLAKALCKGVDSHPGDNPFDVTPEEGCEEATLQPFLAVLIPHIATSLDPDAYATRHRDGDVEDEIDPVELLMAWVSSLTKLLYLAPKVCRKTPAYAQVAFAFGTKALEALADDRVELWAAHSPDDLYQDTEEWEEVDPEAVAISLALIRETLDVYNKTCWAALSTVAIKQFSKPQWQAQHAALLLVEEAFNAPCIDVYRHLADMIPTILKCCGPAVHPRTRYTALRALGVLLEKNDDIEESSGGDAALGKAVARTMHGQMDAMLAALKGCVWGAGAVNARTTRLGVCVAVAAFTSKRITPGQVSGCAGEWLHVLSDVIKGDNALKDKVHAVTAMGAIGGALKDKFAPMWPIYASAIDSIASDLEGCVEESVAPLWGTTLQSVAMVVEGMPGNGAPIECFIAVFRPALARLQASATALSHPSAMEAEGIRTLFAAVTQVVSQLDAEELTVVLKPLIAIASEVFTSHMLAAERVFHDVVVAHMDKAKSEGGDDHEHNLDCGCVEDPEEETAVFGDSVTAHDAVLHHVTVMVMELEMAKEETVILAYFQELVPAVTRLLSSTTMAKRRDLAAGYLETVCEALLERDMSALTVTSAHTAAGALLSTLAGVAKESESFTMIASAVFRVLSALRDGLATLGQETLLPTDTACAWADGLVAAWKAGSVEIRKLEASSGEVLDDEEEEEARATLSSNLKEGMQDIAYAIEDLVAIMSTPAFFLRLQEFSEEAFADCEGAMLPLSFLPTVWYAASLPAVAGNEECGAVISRGLRRAVAGLASPDDFVKQNCANLVGVCANKSAELVKPLTGECVEAFYAILKRTGAYAYRTPAVKDNAVAALFKLAASGCMGDGEGRDACARTILQHLPLRADSSECQHVNHAIATGILNPTFFLLGSGNAFLGPLLRVMAESLSLQDTAISSVTTVEEEEGSGSDVDMEEDTEDADDDDDARAHKHKHTGSGCCGGGGDHDDDDADDDEEEEEYVFVAPEDVAALDAAFASVSADSSLGEAMRARVADLTHKQLAVLTRHGLTCLGAAAT